MWSWLLEFCAKCYRTAVLWEELQVQVDQLPEPRPQERQFLSPRRRVHCKPA
ncbi:hypothetical protein GW17_00019516 [Ensete ventricosum]|nr:hypothetical protein GW17_00019516 [Ensete ventricosum]